MTDTERNAPGPKAADPDHPINTHVPVTCSTEQKNRWTREAIAANKSLGTYLRELIKKGEAADTEAMS